MILYLSGPITGLPDNNAAYFQRAADDLKLAGHEPVNPLDLGIDPGQEEGDARWAAFLAMEIRVIANVDALVMLPGWSASRGCAVETLTARVLGKPVLRLDDLQPISDTLLCDVWGQWAT